ncbi:MAG: MFS transporter, partial [Aggregatilineales bacterium]
MDIIKDLRSFLIVWFGQMLSLTGTGMKRFALMIWAYQQTGDALSLTLLGFFSFIGYVIVSPVAGLLVDRVNRRWVMFFADLGAGLVTIVLMMLFVSGHLELWHLYLAEFIIGTLEAFQVTAYSAAISTLIPQKHYARGNALRSIAYYSSEIAAPFLGGLLLTIADIEVVLMVDIVTFLIGLGTLLLVKFPAVKKSTADTGTTFWQKITFGWRYIVQRPGLFWMMMFMLVVNLFASLTYFSVLPVLILERTGGDELALATVQSILGVGGVIGGIILSIWGGPKRLIHGVLFCTGISFLLGDFLFAVGLSLPVWMLAAAS